MKFLSALLLLTLLAVSAVAAQNLPTLPADRGPQFDPRNGAAVVGGPAPRRLAALPVKLVDGIVTVAAPFTGGVGAQR